MAKMKRTRGNQKTIEYAALPESLL